MTDTRQQDNTTYELVKRLVRESIRPYLAWIAFALVCMACVAGATAVSALLMKPVINDVFVARTESLLIPIALAVIATFAVKGIANYGQSVLTPANDLVFRYGVDAPTIRVDGMTVAGK